MISWADGESFAPVVGNPGCDKQSMVFQHNGIPVCGSPVPVNINICSNGRIAVEADYPNIDYGEYTRGPLAGTYDENATSRFCPTGGSPIFPGAATE